MLLPSLFMIRSAGNPLTQGLMMRQLVRTRRKPTLAHPVCQVEKVHNSRPEPGKASPTRHIFASGIPNS